MEINATVFGQFILVFAPLVAVLSYYLGRRKTENPLLAALLGLILAIIPPFALVYLAALLLKKDRSGTAVPQS